MVRLRVALHAEFDVSRARSSRCAALHRPRDAVQPRVSQRFGVGGPRLAGALRGGMGNRAGDAPACPLRAVRLATGRRGIGLQPRGAIRLRLRDPRARGRPRKPETRPRTEVRATHPPEDGRVHVACRVWPARLAVAQEAPPAAPPPPAAPEATKTEPSWKISGLVYGDYYWLAADHREALEDQNGFWFRRIYLTYDHTFSKAFSARLRLEMNSPGDFSSSERMTPYVKDAWVKWTHGGHAVSFGLAPTPSFEFVESVWGYRSVEKTPLDLLRWDSSRDIGLLAQGELGGRTRYSVQVGNGSGVNGETDRAKAFRAAVRHEIVKGLTVEGYADLQDRAGADRWSTWQVFGAFVRPAGRLGAQVAEQHRRSASGRRCDAQPRVGLRSSEDSRPSLRVRPRRPQLRSGARRRDD